MPIPLAALAAVYAGSKLVQALGKGKAAKKQAEAQRQADVRKLLNEQMAYSAGEKKRGATVSAAGQALVKGSKGLPPGSPDYSIDPGLLATIGAERPYSGSLPPDPRAGMGWNLVAGLAGGVGDAAKTYAQGAYGTKGVGVAPTGATGDPGSASTESANVAWPNQDQPWMDQGRGAICGLYPDYPGCPRSAPVGPPPVN